MKCHLIPVILFLAPFSEFKKNGSQREDYFESENWDKSMAALNEGQYKLSWTNECTCGDVGNKNDASLKWTSWRFALKTKKNGREYFCSADLISSKHLLTARDCVEDMEEVTLLKYTTDNPSKAISIKRMDWIPFHAQVWNYCSI